jgi:hypothetical protein
MLSNQTKVAVAAAFNGGGLQNHMLGKEDLKNIIMWEMSDYFDLNPESRQFDKNVVLAELKAISDDARGYDELLWLLTEIGFRAPPQPPDSPVTWEVDDELWQKFFAKTPVDW